MSSRYIPEAVKQEVRRRSVFGCVVCGTPIYHYDHIEDYHEVQGHDVDNIVLLCPTHHQDKTSGRLSREAVRECAKNPCNASRDFTKPHSMSMVGNAALFEAGSNKFEFSFDKVAGKFSAIEIFQQPVLGLNYEEGYLLLDVLLTDGAGNTLVVIEKGELKVSTSIRDCQIAGREIVVTPVTGVSPFRARFLANGLSVQSGFIALKKPGYTILRRPDLAPISAVSIEPNRCVIYPGQNVISRSVMTGCRVGISVK